MSKVTQGTLHRRCLSMVAFSDRVGCVIKELLLNIDGLRDKLAQ